MAEAKITPEQAQQLAPPAERPIQFSKDIQPILEASCTKCHGRGKSKGGFRLDNRQTFLKGGDSGPAVVPGKSEESLLVELVAGFNPDLVMPQKGSRLKPDQIALLRAWIDQGLPWDSKVSFAKAEPANLKPRRPALPAGQGNHAVDLLLQPYYERHGIQRGQPVDDRLFARRAYLDVIGLLPTPEQLDRFIRDPRPDKRQQLVDQLLADNQRYAEHWLSFWNDLLRNDYRGTGYIDGGRKQITKWLFTALAQNFTYDRFVAELIHPKADSEGFIKGIVWRGVVNASQTPQLQAAQNISQVFMGVNLKCASCHDSFINDWALADAYGLASIYADAPLEMYQCDKPTGEIAQMKFIYPELGTIDPQAPKEVRLEQLARIITGKENGRLTRTIVNRLWAQLMGRGLIEPLDDMERPAWHTDLLDWLAADLAGHDYDLKQTLRLILTSAAYQLPAVSLNDKERREYVFRGPAVRRMSAEQFRDALGSLTSIWHPAPAASDLNFWAGATPERQAKLLSVHAPGRPKWIWTSQTASQDAPAQTVYFRRKFNLPVHSEEATLIITADNRFTCYLNGTQISSGKDWEKLNLVEIRSRLVQGENLFAVAAVNDAPEEKSDQNKSAETAEAHETKSPNPAGLFIYARITARGEGQTVFDLSGDESWVWSTNKVENWENGQFIAQDWQPAAELGDQQTPPWKVAGSFATAISAAAQYGRVRTAMVVANPLLVALGRPNREQVVTSRPSVATTLQALELTNGDTLSKLLREGARRLVTEFSGSAEALVERVYRTALGRRPTTEEWRLSLGLVGQRAQAEGVEDLLWAVSVLPEFQLIY